MSQAQHDLRLAEDASRRLPADIAALLSPEQVARLGALLAMPISRHALDYRVSTSILGRRMYLAVLSGREGRTPGRVRREGHHLSAHGFLLRVVMVCGWVTVTALSLSFAMLILIYLTKSLLGIDLFDGPSLLHGWFFD